MPERYQWQVQHQLMVTQAQVADVFVYDGMDGIQLEVTPDPSTWPQIHAAWDAFMRCVTESQAPQLTARDTRVRDDPEWLSAAEAYVEAKHAADVTATVLDNAKSQLIQLTGRAKEEGGGVTVTQFWKKGAVEYKRVPELAGVDIDAYRGPDRHETRITVA